MKAILKAVMDGVNGSMVPTFNPDVVTVYTEKTGRNIVDDLEECVKTGEIVKDQLLWYPNDPNKNLRIIDESVGKVEVRIAGKAEIRFLNANGRIMEDIYYLPDKVPQVVFRKKAGQETAAKILNLPDEELDKEVEVLKAQDVGLGPETAKEPIGGHEDRKDFFAAAKKEGEHEEGPKAVNGE